MSRVTLTQGVFAAQEGGVKVLYGPGSEVRGAPAAAVTGGRRWHPRLAPASHDIHAAKHDTHVVSAIISILLRCEAKLCTASITLQGNLTQLEPIHLFGAARRAGVQVCWCHSTLPSHLHPGTHQHTLNDVTRRS